MDASFTKKNIRILLDAARNIAVLTGAGISAESGLPTFRGAGGLWQTHRVEELASPEGFARDPRLVWSWYLERRRAHARAEPSTAHRALAELEMRSRGFTLVTQNVDSLHRRAGSQNVLELHGHLREARCTRCRARRELDDAFDLDALRHDCGGMWRPDIVWFGESLPGLIWERAVDAVVRADILFVIGTSGLVNPAAALVTTFARNAAIIEINPEETAITSCATYSVRDTASAVLPELLRAN